MHCKNIQDLLKTDYLDGRIEESKKELIKQHLDNCSHCRALEKELVETQLFLKKAKQQPVPERVWQNIEQAILTEQLELIPQADQGILGRLRDFLFPRRAVFALASTAAAIAIVMVLAGRFIYSRGKGNERAGWTEYALHIESERSLNGLDTSIEEYFL